MIGAVDLAWLVLVPLAYLGVIAAVLGVARYWKQLRSLDIYILSFLLSLFLNLSIPICAQLTVSIFKLTWTRSLCVAYVWAWNALRLSELLVLFALSLDRLFIFRNSGNYKYYGSRDKVCLVLILWIVSGFIAAVPVVGWTTLDITVAETCFFVGYDVNMYFGISIALVILWFFAMTLGCASDALYNMTSFRRSALYCVDQYTIAGCSSLNRSTLTRRMNSASSSLNRIGTLQRIYRLSNPSLDQKSVISDACSLPPEVFLPTSTSINCAFDNCRFAFLVVAASYVINHVPFAVVSLYGSLSFAPWPLGVDVSLWLVLMEALMWPHLLWLANSRYRQGYVYLLEVLTCREPLCTRDDGDVGEVRLQSYTVRPSEFSREARPPSLRLDTLDDIRRMSRGEPFMLDAMRRYHDNLTQRGVLVMSSSTSVLPRSDSPVDIPRRLRRGSEPNKLQRSRSDVGYGSRRASIRKSFHGSPRKPVQADHVRSPRLNSRLEWKRRMREQFLPAAYVQECERMDACINPIYGVSHAQNIPEESPEVSEGPSFRQEVPGTEGATSTLSSCDTMIVYEEELSSEELSMQRGQDASGVEIVNNVSDAAIENAFAIRQLNMAALSRGAEGHAHDHNVLPEITLQVNGSSSENSSNADDYQDAVTHLTVFATHSSRSSVSEDLFPTEADSSPEPEFVSVAASPVLSEVNSLCSIDINNSSQNIDDR